MIIIRNCETFQRVFNEYQRICIMKILNSDLTTTEFWRRIIRKFHGNLYHIMVFSVYHITGIPRTNALWINRANPKDIVSFRASITVETAPWNSFSCRRMGAKRRRLEAAGSEPRWGKKEVVGGTDGCKSGRTTCCGHRECILLSFSRIHECMPQWDVKRSERGRLGIAWVTMQVLNTIFFLYFIVYDVNANG